MTRWGGFSLPLNRFYVYRAMAPDPKTFARSVLWLLATVEADVYRNQLLLDQVLSRITGLPVQDIQAITERQFKEVRRKTFLQSIKAAGLYEEGDEHGPDDWNGGNQRA